MFYRLTQFALYSTSLSVNIEFNNKFRIALDGINRIELVGLHQSIQIDLDILRARFFLYAVKVNVSFWLLK